MKVRSGLLLGAAFVSAATALAAAPGCQKLNIPNGRKMSVATSASPPGSRMPARPPGATVSPLSFKIGGANFTPFGFVDFTAVYRSTNVGSGIGTSFGSIPFNAASPAGRLSEIRFSAQNSRVGLKVDADPSGDLKLRAYLEADFLGSAPRNLEVTSHSDTLRMRLYWIDARWGKWEVLGGQSWSLMTPGRIGISPMPADIFYTKNMDTDYQVGLVWLRTPGIRAVFRPDGKWSFAVALEDPDQYTGGLVKFPAGFNASQVDDAGGNAKAPNVAPDLIAKVAYDRDRGGHALHIEMAGLCRVFRLNTSATNAKVTRSGGGGSLNLNYEVMKHLRLVGASFWSDGGGRYIFGLGPDFVVKVSGSGSFVPSPIHAGSGIGGFEYRATPKTMLYGYYGVAYFGQNYQQAAAGPPPVFIGYGYPSSGGAQNRTIQEATFGAIETLWKRRGYGDLKIITQASYLSRNPWSNTTTPNGARSAHLGMAYVDLRYDLP